MSGTPPVHYTCTGTASCKSIRVGDAEIKIPSSYRTAVTSSYVVVAENLKNCILLVPKPVLSIDRQSRQGFAMTKCLFFATAGNHQFGIDPRVNLLHIMKTSLRSRFRIRRLWANN